MEQQVREVLEEKPAVSLKDLAINGKDLIDLGYQEGVELGEMLKKLLEIVIDKPELNRRERLLEFLETGLMK
jgi:tRNA nucleotidyltransferase (CCA-adding enzyme)